MRRPVLLAGSALVLVLASAIWLGWKPASLRDVLWPPGAARSAELKPPANALRLDWSSLDSRPLQNGTALPAGSCPVSNAHPPASLGVIPEPAVAINPWRLPTHRYTTIMWQLVGGPYAGPILLRGGRIGGEGPPLLGISPAPSDASDSSLPLPDGHPVRAAETDQNFFSLYTGMRLVAGPGAESWWTYVYIETPGCYFWQEDYGAGTGHLIFEAIS